jgi:hypothetical protein
MRIAEALARRAELRKKLEQLTHRAARSARYQEGEAPAENSQNLLEDAVRIVGEMAALIQRVNRTNAQTFVQPGVTITDAIAMRDRHARTAALYNKTADAAVGQGNRIWGRQLRTELKEVTDLNVPVLRQRADDASRQQRELDLLIQRKNWETDLLE